LEVLSLLFLLFVCPDKSRAERHRGVTGASACGDGRMAGAWLADGMGRLAERPEPFVETGRCPVKLDGAPNIKVSGGRERPTAREQSIQ